MMNIRYLSDIKFIAMKVLFVHCSYKFKGGEDTVVEEEIRLLRSNGVSVDLLKFSNEKNVFLKVLQLPFNISSYVKTRKKLNDFRPDIVHIHNMHFAGTASILYAIRKSKIPFVITLHNFRLLCPSGILYFNGKPFLDSVNQPFPWNAVYNGVYRDSKLLTLWVGLSMQLHNLIGTWEMCNRYIVLSQHAKAIFAASKMKHLRNLMTVKPNFCLSPGLVRPLNPDFFLYVGRLSDEKDIMLLLNAIATSGYHLKIAGDGPLKEEVIKFSSKYPHIEYLGLLKKEEVFSFLNNCSALVFPSKWYEGMPLTIIEAFACGAPVIASKIGVMEQMINNRYDGLHFEPGNVIDLADKLKIWQNFDEEEKAGYRENARHTYEKFYTPEKNFEQLLLIYNSVLAEKEEVVKVGQTRFIKPVSTV